MTETIRLYSVGNGHFTHMCYSLGCLIDGTHLVFNIGENTGRNRNDIKFLDVSDNYLGCGKTAKEIVVELFKQNNIITYPKAKGYASNNIYNVLWTIGFREDLRSWFEENEIPFPVEMRSLEEQLKAKSDAVLSHYGLKPQGQAAIEAAKNAKAAEATDDLKKQLADLQAKLESQAAELEALKVQTPVQEPVQAPVQEPDKKDKKTK